ncbi:protein spaetzle 4 isoform X2 [Bombus pyrosoma]|uniref:protein spaetzle 4 isoform X2 n=1 Tax=Bombus pyrosoma TaxID=396416 RepID=UPI001CB9BBD7|nr:protein spaetzle 4 isoform X2 [Bombus pyrosoma]
MNVIVHLVLQVIIYQLVRCQGGGPSTFGYDASSACSKPYSRVGRSRFENLPCDFQQQSWCTVAGSGYPWHAVRRFVHENKGLMRRMYGDERHINVLKAEFERDDIELNYDDYYQHPADDHKKYQHVHDYDYFDLKDNLKRNGNEFEGRSFTSRPSNGNAAKRANEVPKSNEHTRPHFRPTEKTTTSTSSATTSTATTSTTTASLTKEKTSSTITSTASPTNKTTTQSTPSITSSVANRTNEEKGNFADKVTTLPVATKFQALEDQSFDINEIVEHINRVGEAMQEDDEVSVEVSESSPEKTSTVNLSDTTEFPEELNDSESLFATPKGTTVQDETLSSINEQEFRPRPEYRPAIKPETSTMGEQLYQDAAVKDQQGQPVLKLRGANACPVKEEVVAPFWANNTRGEVLALLNLYPFEQYVHWEKCTHENKQMYCRNGCRCEQQYRLHRLLAYDPNNECRGIFSDWFKFPSCCVCRCYDLPLQFHVTSRSPRTQKQQVKVRPPQTH